MEIEQQRSPAWHPDGQSVVFAGNLLKDSDGSFETSFWIGSRF